MIKSKLGRFYVGDPCYVLSEENYHGIWGDKYNFSDGQIQIFAEQGFIVHGTAYGDGEYEDQFMHRYGVDSGTLAVVPLELCEKTNGLKNGAVFEGSTADLDYYDDGVFTISVGDKNIIINTGDEVFEDEEDPEEYEDYEEYDESLQTTTVDEDYEVLEENPTEEYWDAKEIARDGFDSLLKFNFGTDSQGNNYIITKDANDIKRFYANTDEEAIEVYNKWKNAPRNGFGDYVLDEDLNSNYNDVDIDVNPEEDISERVLSIVDVEAVVERVNELLNKIQPSEEPYITADWVYDGVRFKHKPLTPEEVKQYEAEDIPVYGDIADPEIKYVLDDDTYYHKDITMGGISFDFIYTITDYYNCVIKVYDVVPERDMS